MARLRNCAAGRRRSSMSRRYSQMKSPVAASRACTTLPGLAMYITPSWTTGVVCDTPASSPQDHASRSSPTLSLSISSSGL